MSATNNPTPGEARGPGPSVADTLRRDSREVPAPLLEQHYAFSRGRGSAGRALHQPRIFPTGNHRLWPNAWQWACRSDTCPMTGDSYVRHRPLLGIDSAHGRRRRKGLPQCLHAPGYAADRCPGVCLYSSITCPSTAGPGTSTAQCAIFRGSGTFLTVGDSHNLAAVRCEVWGGFIFINLNPEAAPLADYLQSCQRILPVSLERRRIRAHVQKHCRPTGRSPQEAFMEAYHNFETLVLPTAPTPSTMYSASMSAALSTLSAVTSPTALADYPWRQWRSPPMSEQEMLADLSIEGRSLAASERRDRSPRSHREQLRHNWG